MISDKETSYKFIETVNEGFKRLMEKQQRLKKNTLKGFFSDPFKRGVKIRLEYVTIAGLKVCKDDFYKGVVTSVEFKSTFFSLV